MITKKWQQKLTKWELNLQLWIVILHYEFLRCKHTYWFVSTPPKGLTIWAPRKLTAPFKTIESVGASWKWFKNEEKNRGSNQKGKSLQRPIHLKIAGFLDLRQQPLCSLNSFLLKLKVHIHFRWRKVAENIVTWWMFYHQRSLFSESFSRVALSVCRFWSSVEFAWMPTQQRNKFITWFCLRNHHRGRGLCEQTLPSG